MRPSGVVGSVRGLRAGDHVCWCFASEPELAGIARDLLADADEHGDRFTFIGTSPVSELSAKLERWTDAARVVAGDAVEIVSLAELSEEELADPPRVFVTAAEDALRAGFDGMRVLSACSDLVAAGAVGDHVRWEHVVDRYVSDGPFSCVCAYDRRVLDQTTVTELAAVHPLVSHRVPVQVFAVPGADLGLRGDLDASSVALLEDVLGRIPPLEDDGPVIIDATEVGFVDVGSLRALDAYAQHNGLSTIELRNAPASAVRILELVTMPHVRTGGEEV